MLIRAGYYIADGVSGRTVTTNIQADFILVNRSDTITGSTAVAKTSTMAADAVKDLDSNVLGLETGCITSITATGFTLGTDVRTNAAGYGYHWLAIQKEVGDTNFEVGTYNGNGSDNRNISLASITATPDYVAVFGEFAAGAFWRSSSHSGDSSGWFTNVAAHTTNGIQAFGAGTFQVGTRDQVNHGAGTPVYHYVAWNEVAGLTAIPAARTGNSTDNTSVTGAGFQPNFSFCQRISTSSTTMMRGPSHQTLQSSYLSVGLDETNSIQAFESDGHQVGNDAKTNTTGTYIDIFLLATVVAQPTTSNMKQVLMGGTDSLGNSSYYVDGWCTSAAAGGADMLIPEAGYITKLKVTLTAAPGGTAFRKIAVVLNGTSSGLLAILQAGETTVSLDAAMHVVAGDTLSISNVNGGVPTASAAYWGLQYEAITAQRAIWGSGTSTTISNSATRYGLLGATANDNFASTDTSIGIPWGLFATIKSYYIKLSVAPGGAASRRFQIYKNGSAEASSIITITGAATTGNATGLSIAIAPNDLLCEEDVPTGTPALSGVKVGVSYQPTNDGQWNISGMLGADFTNGQFAALNSYNSSASTEVARTISTTASTGAILPLLQGLYVITATSPGGGNSRTYTERQSGASSTVVVTLSNAETSDATNNVVTTVANDTASLLLNLSGAAASLSSRWTLTGALNAPPPGGGHGGGGGHGPPGGPPGQSRPERRVRDNGIGWDWFRRIWDPSNLIPLQGSILHPDIAEWPGWRFIGKRREHREYGDEAARNQMPVVNPPFPPITLPPSGFSNWDYTIPLPRYEDTVELPRYEETTEMTKYEDTLQWLK